MAEFNAAVGYVDEYLKGREEFLSGKKPRIWFTSGASKLAELLDAFDPTSEDEAAYQTYVDMKQKSNMPPVDKEAKHRLRLLFMAAAKQTARQQYMAGSANGYRTINDTFRYEMANTRAVRGCLRKLRDVTEKMGEKK